MATAVTSQRAGGGWLEGGWGEAGREFLVSLKASRKMKLVTSHPVGTGCDTRK